MQTLQEQKQQDASTALATLNKVIEEFSRDPDVVGFVKKVESSLATTQNHYGDYLGFLTPYASDKIALHVISQALIRAGADPEGVAWALRLIKGGE